MAKITLHTCAAGPDGVARPGTVLDMSEARAKEWIDARFARAFDKDLDRRAPTGWTKAKDVEE